MAALVEDRSFIQYDVSTATSVEMFHKADSAKHGINSLSTKSEH